MTIYWILTVLIAALPVAELRGAIPLAVFVWNISPLTAFFLAVIGNFLIVIPLLWFWHFAVHRLAKRYHFVHRCKEWMFDRTHRRHGGKFELLKEFALFFLVAIPLPFTGAWTGTVAAYLFGVPFWRAVLWIGLGIIFAGILVGVGVGLFV
ncbi:ligand-binding protein SH3 [bacterium]|nr:ligand-binding protein SH3 [bacterium]|tara:strand:+ start:1955 stop:2407 length:453 start_codon:yes stop_codon:yes gene_type:complete